MASIVASIYLVFPIISILLLIIGFKTKHKHCISIALWLSLIAVLFEYHTAGGEILGSYFNYRHTAIYSLNLIVLIIAIIYLMFYSFQQARKPFVRGIASLTVAIAVTATFVLATNLWINAYFVENRLANTPLLQVATFRPVSYCNYSHVFYKINQDGQVQYMCPNYYGFLPSIGRLDVAPPYVLKQLPLQLQTKFSPQTIDKKP